jgi:K+-transporting ATPase c subunit
VPLADVPPDAVTTSGSGLDLYVLMLNIALDALPGQHRA